MSGRVRVVRKEYTDYAGPQVDGIRVLAGVLQLQTRNPRLHERPDTAPLMESSEESPGSNRVQKRRKKRDWQAQTSEWGRVK